MDQPDLLGFLIITLNCNVTMVGKIWLIFMVPLRLGVLILAGLPVYQDEQERFVCNTLQPGCANVCYDIFAPVSHLRFWLIQSMSVLLPSAVFSVYVLHRGAQLAARGSRGPDDDSEDHHAPERTPGARRCLMVPDFSLGYVVHLCLRTMMEAAFGAVHYLLFGFLVPKRFSCTHPPCTSVVDCYVSRPTEKSILMLFVWAVCALSFLLSVADLVCSVPWKTRRRPGGARRKPCQGAGDAAREGHGAHGGRAARARPGLRTGGQGAHNPAADPAQQRRRELPGEEESDALSSASDQLPLAGPGVAAPGWEERPCAPRARLQGPSKSEWV
ncbi:gap junction delta-4 protein [Hippopotamus amphibius kiboko]|uniref:gap junction delta-4 protein n=1 Tax=Hippopotamus amphibius kiboko TaxID=575201 RepID=UPI0025972859|nr:gap junction delta-4 protein [Hippopotamus amphibius kiboko]